MATYSIRKVASTADATQIGGLITSRYEKASMAFGTVPAGSYKLGDTLSFDDVDAQYIVEARITAHTSGTAVSVLDVVPGTNLNTGELKLSLGAGTDGTTDGPLLSYVIYYIRGNGASPTTRHLGGDGDLTVRKSGDGNLIQVKVTAASVASTTTSTESGPTV
jgi:hypothetical protein